MAVAGIYHLTHSRTQWDTFRKEYEKKILANLAADSQREAKTSLDHFQRIVHPANVSGIQTKSIDTFISTRRLERGKKPGSKLAPATVNKDLRHLKAALNVAVEWGYLTARPRIRMVKEPKKVPTYVTPAHFQDIYLTACPKANLPRSPGQTFLAADWWRALVVTAYMTGFRIGEILALRWEDLDLEKGILFTRAEDNKGSRDESLRVHPVVMEHLEKVKTDSPYVFRWPHEKSILWEEFARIQREAGIKLVCRHSHNHTPACHVYSFHDFRRAFATVNAPRMKGEALQRLMRHKSYTTTLGYINLASQIDDAVTEMPLPPALQKGRKKTPGEGAEQP